MNGFSHFFLVLLFLSLACQWWLARRHIAHVCVHRHRVPRVFAQRIPLEAHQKAADYTVSRTRFESVSAGYHSLLLLAWTLGGGLETLDRAWQSLALPPLIHGVAVFLSVLFLTAVLELPLRIYRIFVIEQRFGFNRTGPGLFVADLLREALIGLLLATPLLALVLWLLAPQGDMNLRPWWWFYVWLVWIGFSLLMLWLYPALIAPLFNRFTPLDDQTLLDRIQRLLQRSGFTSRGVFVMDGSRRSRHGNAYFTGLGRHKRIVFYDTLLHLLTPAETEAVLAHELGHFRLRHIQKRLAGSASLSLLGLLVLDALLRQEWFFTGLGVSQPAPHLGLLLFLLVAPVFGFFLNPLLLRWSRRHEYEADRYAAQQASATALASALVKLYEDNAATLTPDPWYSAFHDSHPPALQRIARLLQEQPLQAMDAHGAAP